MAVVTLANLCEKDVAILNQPRVGSHHTRDGEIPAAHNDFPRYGGGYLF
jgi:hypothetical protein